MNETRKPESCREDTQSKKRNACCSPADASLEHSNSSPCYAAETEPNSLIGAGAKKKYLNIDLLYLDLDVCERCIDTESVLSEAIQEVSRVLETTGVEVVLNKIHVTSEEQAVDLGFLVSPTIRLNGRDIQMHFRESLCDSCATLCDCEGGVSCREWEYQGQWYNAPPKGLIVESILREVYGGDGTERVEPVKLEQTPENLKRFFSSLSKY